MRNKLLLSMAAGGLSAATAFGFILHGDENSSLTVLPDRQVITFTQSGTLTVNGSGTVRLLLVGGGGGGGNVVTPADLNRMGGGGGAGGVVYTNSLVVGAGVYQVVVGDGGAPNSNGGDTSLFGLVAYGGGGGANGEGNKGNDGGSGGGSTLSYADSTAGGKTMEGGQAIYGSAGNLGNAGGDAVHCYSAGGGGGAGSASTLHSAADSGPMHGGDGLEFDIIGTNVWYAGGGGGGKGRYNVAAKGGKGGGGGSGEAGAPNTGGGGGGGVTTADGTVPGCSGGSGIVIVSFVPEISENTDDFKLSGGDRKIELADDEVLVFTNSGSVTVEGYGRIELLAVGGGGGGGNPSDAEYNRPGGGGGAGGVLHLTDIVVSPGTYQVEIGDGGAANSNGGNTVAFGGLVAFGGGGGANGEAGKGKDGASGGGATCRAGDDNVVTNAGGTAIYMSMSAGNLGHDGGASSNRYNPGGGGGAGSASTVRASDGRAMHGGDGLEFDMCGTNVWYAGGGAGGRTKWTSDSGAAVGGKGGGGACGVAGTPNTGGGGGGGGAAYQSGARIPGGSGGSGVVIVRYRRSTNLPGYAKEFCNAIGGTATRRKEYMIHTFTEDGEFVMPRNGYVEALLVGGGGGGGIANSSGANAGGGGGGGGGVMHVECYPLSAGTHSIKVGAGGALNSNGGDTIAFDGLVAFGGGGGANNMSGRGKDGASGGGATCSPTDDTNAITNAGGSAVYMSAGNFGHDGGFSSHRYGAGGGGGAGGDGSRYSKVVNGVGDRTYPKNGGDGLPFSISGEEQYYGGGGAGSRSDWNTHTTGGLGGGGAGGVAGTDGLGGGGGGDAKGGSGVVIIRYKLSKSGLILTFR